MTTKPVDSQDTKWTVCSHRAAEALTKIPRRDLLELVRNGAITCRESYLSEDSGKRKFDFFVVELKLLKHLDLPNCTEITAKKTHRYRGITQTSIYAMAASKIVSLKASCQILATDPQSTTESDVHPEIDREYMWNAEPNLPDVVKGLANKQGAILTLAEASRLLSQPVESLQAAMKAKKIRRYRLGFCPFEVIKLGESHGGLFATYHSESIIEYDSETEEPYELLVDRGITVKNKLFGTRVRSTTHSSTRSAFLWGTMVIDEVRRIVPNTSTADILKIIDG